MSSEPLPALAGPIAVEEREVWAVNKPAGFVSTAKEPGSRPAVVTLVEALGERSHASGA